MFSDVSTELIELIKSIAVTEQLEPHRHILCDPDAPPTIWFVVEGLLELTYGDEEGRQATVLLVDPEDGWVAPPWPQGTTHSIQITALKPTILLRVTAMEFQRLVTASPEFNAKFMDFAWRRIGRLQARLAESMTRNVKGRLADLLLELGSVFGETRDQGQQCVPLPMTHHELGRLVGASREMVTKVLGQFRAAGWVQSNRGRIEVVNKAALQVVR